MTAFDDSSLALLKADQPSWRASHMEAAFDVFKSLDEPSGAEEDWRYVSYNMPFDELSPVSEPGDRLPIGPFIDSVGESEGHVLIVDGQVIKVEAPEGRVSRVANSEERQFSQVSADHNKLAAAHLAFANDGVFIDVKPDEVMEAPLVVEIQGTREGTASFNMFPSMSGKTQRPRFSLFTGARRERVSSWFPRLGST